MLHIYCDQQNPRISYAFKLLFYHLYKVEYEVIDDFNAFKSSTRARLNYSEQILPDVPKILPHEILGQSDIRPQQVSFTEKNGMKTIFPSFERDLLGFDPIAAAFYLATRYEEYLPFNSDSFGRFPYTESIAYKYDFLKIPIVHYWARMLIEALNKAYPDLIIKENDYEFIPTYDIDRVYAFKGKGIVKTMGGSVKSLFSNPKELAHRIQTLFLGREDPYDQYRFIEEIHRKYGSNSIVFFLMADYGGVDINFSPTSTYVKEVIKQCSKFSEIGIHPSMMSNGNEDLLRNEHKNLSEVLEKKISKSRQHYLALSFPKTYQKLIDLGIEDDYSMGYPETPGFRSGITIPYPFYDLEKEQETTLKIHPVTFMEASFAYYKDNSKEKILDELSKVIEVTKDVNGTFYPLWHNESLSDIGIWKGYRFIFEKMFEISQPK